MLGQRRDTSGYEGGSKSTHIPKTFPSDQRVDPNPVAPRCLALPESGAGDGNRTQMDGASKPLKNGISRSPDRSMQFPCDFSRLESNRRPTPPPQSAQTLLHSPPLPPPPT